MKKKSKNVAVFGVFERLHLGHIRFLHFSASLGDRLTVGLLDVGNEVTYEVRKRKLLELEIVDEVVVLEEGPLEFIKIFKPDVVVKGREFEHLNNPELDIIEGYRGQLIFSSGETRFYSEDLRKNEMLDYVTPLQIPTQFLKNHQISSKKINEILQSFSSLKVMVVGDSIVDEYVECDPLGMSQEDPTLVVRPSSSENFLGGAGIVAAHAKSLGSEVHFFTVTGDDEHGVFVSEKAIEYGVNYHGIVDVDRPTTHKKRYRALGKTMLRVNTFLQQPISSQIQLKIMTAIENLLIDTDVLIFSDFNYGLLTKSLIEKITKLAKRYNVIICADSQSSSQYGDVSRFIGADLITPTEREARMAVNEQQIGLVSLAQKLNDKLGVKNILITLGHKGVLIHSQSGKGWENDTLPALNASAKDPAGGGDALLVLVSMSIAAKATIWEACYLASVGAAIQVGRLGNLPIKKIEIMSQLDRWD